MDERASHSWPDYLINRAMATPIEGCPIVYGSTPVVSFGHPLTPRVATLGINPSSGEFLGRDKTFLDGPKRRLATLKSLGVGGYEDLTPSHAGQIIQDCADYFDRQPYGWFNPLNQVLSAALGLSYLIAEEAFATGLLSITEVEAGSVPEVAALNSAEVPVLLLSGEHIEGAMQNRVLNSTALIAARHKTILPVACIEHGRWHYEAGDQLAPSDDIAYSRLRSKNAASAANERPDRGEPTGKPGRSVGRGALKHHERLVDNSPTGAMRDAYDISRGEINEILSEFRGPEPGQTGTIACISGECVALDAFDRPGCATCASTGSSSSRSAADRPIDQWVLSEWRERNAPSPGPDVRIPYPPAVDYVSPEGPASVVSGSYELFDLVDRARHALDDGNDMTHTSSLHGCRISYPPATDSVIQLGRGHPWIRAGPAPVITGFHLLLEGLPFRC